jgi:hypothetical protein
MPPRVTCTDGDHRPPPSGGSCACGMVTRIPTRQPVRSAPRPLVPTDVRDALARCLYDGPGDPLAPDVTDHRPDDMRMSGVLRRRADRMIAALAAAGLVVSADGEIRQAA